ncbi:hypothetical protein KBX50_29010 [Micromonospora sp. C51]|uniref:hypothetical protein n=1 Tax=Micromonospora sp. C51 TaxID=2824879 RepID=UPI001B38A5D6|nr:hypothetical protein [Micromonospora sp. C51]MBQ1052478.1 hypothetical protein [Micromonospora sp. C51]
MHTHDLGNTPNVEGYGCRTCGVPLTVITATDGQRTFTHPQFYGDHKPDPAPLSELTTVRMACDFCSAPDPVASFEFGSLNIEMIAPDDHHMKTHHLGGKWAACEGCARLVEAHDVDGLTDRAVKRARRRGLPSDADMFGPLHRALFATTPGTPARQPLSIGPAPEAQATPTVEIAPPTQLRTLRPQMLPKVRDRLVRFWRTSARTHLLTTLDDGAAYTVPGHMLPGAALDARPVVIDSGNPAPLDRYTALMASHAENARIFWIDPDFTALAMHAARDLTDIRITPAEMPTPDGFLIWHTPVCNPALPDTGVGVPIIGAQWGPIPGGVWTTFLTPAETVTQGQPLTEREMQDLRERFGWLLPVSTGAGLRFERQYRPNSEQTNAMLRALIATWILTTQPDAEITEQQADKSTRKAYQRANRPTPVVRLVRLRRKQEARQATEGKPGRVYTRRWWVSGFFREQPCGPGRSQRRRTYVRPHIKGPADAPLILTDQVHILGNPPHHTEL